MKFREVFGSEFAHRMRSASTWVFAALLFGIGFLIMSGGATAKASIHANGPFQLAFVSLILSLLGLVVTAAFFRVAAVRDVAVEMDPLLFTSPLRPVHTSAAVTSPHWQ